MSTIQRETVSNTGDALIDEVRGVRREVCRQFGNDIDRLYDHLKVVEQDYSARRGVFRGVSKEAAAKVVEGWGEENYRNDDTVVDEVRAMRKALAERRQ